MADPFLSEIYIFPMDWPPRGFAQCDGQLLNVAQNQALCALLGVVWGGDGRTTFGLPDMRGRAPMFYDGTNTVCGTKGGTENVQLVTDTVPIHTHTLVASSIYANQLPPTANYLAPAVNTSDSSSAPTFVPLSASPIYISLSPYTCSVVGEGGTHNNMQPSLALNFCIATVGVWPSRD